MSLKLYIQWISLLISKPLYSIAILASVIKYPDLRTKKVKPNTYSPRPACFCAIISNVENYTNSMVIQTDTLGGILDCSFFIILYIHWVANGSLFWH